MFIIHAGSQVFDSHRRHMSERSKRPGCPRPVCSELENSGIRVAVGGFSVTERWRWRPPYQTGKTIHVYAKILQTQRGRTHGAKCARLWFRTAEPLGERRYEIWITTTTAIDIKQDPGLQSFLQVKVPLILKEVILRHDN